MTLNEKNYKFLEQLLEMLLEIKDIYKLNDEIYEKWYEEYIPMFNFDFTDEDNKFYNCEIITGYIYSELQELIEYGEEYAVDIDLLINELKEFIEDSEKPLTKRRYPDWAKETLIRMLDNEDFLNKASDDEIVLFKRFCDELSEKNNITALNAIGYGYYGGNRVFPCDWKKSEEIMLKLIELDERMPQQAFYANTLGYIYYYGRCNDGVPEYEKAYKYFSFAAFNKVYEAQYKIADMYKNGYGVPKSTATSKTIISALYYENLEYIVNGVFDCKFADIALRIGSISGGEESLHTDYDKALYYYMQADYAIRMRAVYNYYGDKKVRDSISEALKRTKASMDFKPQKSVTVYSLSEILSTTVNTGHPLTVTVKEMASGNFKFNFKPRNKKDRLFITIPELEICGRYDEFSVIAKPHWDDCQIPVTGSIIDKVDCYGAYSGGEEVFDFFDFEYSIRATSKQEKEFRFVAVSFNNSDKYYDYLCDDESIKENDKILVNAAGEEKEVLVCKVLTKKESEMSLPLKLYKKVIRKL